MTIITQRGGRSAALLAALISVAVLALSLAPAADAATAYRFWGYFQSKGTTWTFSTKGADQTKPTDGSVEGWRYAVAGPTDSRMPRGTVAFTDVCAGIPAKSGHKRVAVVLDYGRAADAESGKPPAPTARCAQVPTAATGTEVLAAATDTVRIENKLICGVDGWPAKGCGGEVKEVSAAAKGKDDTVKITLPATAADVPAEPGATGDKSVAAKKSNTAQDDSGILPALIAGGILLLLIIGGGLVVAARRRQRVESA